MTSQYLSPTEFLDHESDEVRDYVSGALRGTGPDPREQAVALYYAVRDGIRYEVYGADLSRNGLTASQIVRTGSGMCLHKSVLYTAGLRSLGIPARLVLTDVRNHLASPRLIELVGGNVFRMHGLASVELDGQWIRATPVFNRTLCRLYRMTPLEFDGRTDSVYHPFDEDGRRQMEFLHQHGEFDDLPYELVIRTLREAHPKLFAQEGSTTFATGSLPAEARALASAAVTGGSAAPAAPVRTGPVV